MECISTHQPLDNAHVSSQEDTELCLKGVSTLDLCSKNKASRQPPAKFSNPETISPPESLRELVARLHEIFESDDISVEYVQSLMASYQSKPREWKRYAKFDPHRYTRNLVDAGNGKFNLMVLCWNEGQGSSIHSHANSHCFLKVLEGSVKEELFEWPSQKPNNSDRNNNSAECQKPLKKYAVNVYKKDECTYINDDIGLHRVENTSHADKAVTLHLYSPPFDECLCFDERTGRAVTSKVTFWSKFGRRTPFGRNPESTLSTSCHSESKEETSAQHQ